MISNPKHGWCDFDLCDFHGCPSYITDVPVDLLQAFIDLHTKGAGIAWFDEEGTEFSLVLTQYSKFIIEEKDKPVLHDYSELPIAELEKEIIQDIESNIKEWSKFECMVDSVEDFNKKKMEIEKMVFELKRYIE